MNFRFSKIIAWHPVLTDHQAYTYKELAIQSGLPVTVQVIRFEDAIRRSQGWTDTRVDGIERKQIPANNFLLYGIRFLLQHRDQVHLFGSAFEDYRLSLLLWFATRLGIECYIISEPYSTVPFGYLENQSAWKERLKTLLRPYLYRFYVLSLRSGLKGVFAISRLALRQFAEAGMSPARLYPFGYFVPTQVIDTTVLSVSDNGKVHSLRLAFVGSLIGRKGLPILISAVQMAIAQGIDIQLDVYGPGEPEPFEFDDVHIRYLGRIPFGKTQHYLLCYDLLVLPSIYDGWGVVVNEALCAGVPVVCSSTVGAGEVASAFGAGLCFTSGDSVSLSNILAKIFKEPLLLESMRAAAPLAANALQPEVAAKFMLNVIRAPSDFKATIPSPWYIN